MEDKNSENNSKLDLILKKLSKLDLIGARLEGIESRLNVIDSRLDGHDKLFAGNEKLLETIVVGLNNHDKQFEKVFKIFGRIETMFNKQWARLEDIENNVKRVQLTSDKSFTNQTTDQVD